MIINDVFFPRYEQSEYYAFLKEHATRNELEDFTVFQELYHAFNTLGFFDDPAITIGKREANEEGSVVFLMDTKALTSKYGELDFLDKLIESFQDYRCNDCGAITPSYRYLLNRSEKPLCVDCSLQTTEDDRMAVNASRMLFGKRIAALTSYKILNNKIKEN